jgi:hypothetical protein
MRLPTASGFFYLEEVEEIRLADEAIYAGRRLHEQIAAR